jgi:glutathione S-transferase
VRYETAMRPKELHWPAWISGQLAKVGNALDVLEREAGDLEGPLNIGQVAVACACTWLEFRNVLPDARKTRPKLFAWIDRMNRERPSFAATMPK